MKKLMNEKLKNNYIDKYSLREYINSSLIKNCELHIFDKNELISTINEEMHYMYFLVHGKAKVYTLLSTGKSLLICFNKPLSIIGDIEFMDNNLADCYVLTLEESICLALPIDKIKEFAYEDQNFLKFIITSLHKKLRNNSTYSAINMLYPLENRFASYILSILPSTSLDSLIVEIEGVTHIAELLGSSYRHLNRVIKTLSDKNILKKEKNIIRILNLEDLKSLANDLYK